MRRPLLVSVVAALLLSGAPQQCLAQISPADSAAVLLQAARTFESQGESDVARAVYELILQRFPSTPAGTAAAARLQGFRSEGTRGSGKVELQVWTTLYGLWLGVAIPGAFGAEDNEPYGVGLLLGGPAGFFGGRAIAGSRDLTEGQARAITLGGLWGGWQAYGWREVFEWGVEERCDVLPWSGGEDTYCYNLEDSKEENFAAMILGSLTGMVVGSQLANRSISPGVATTVNFGALWGTWFGVATGVLMDLQDDDLLAATLLGGDAGLVSMMALAPRWNVSRSRARLVSIAGVIGGLGGAGVDLLVEPDDRKTAIAIPLVMSLAGLGIGIATTRDYDDEPRAAEVGEDLFSPAVVTVRDGRWSVGAPLPYPVMLEGAGPRGPMRTTGLGVTLLSASFR